MRGSPYMEIRDDIHPEGNLKRLRNVKVSISEKIPIEQKNGTSI